MRAAARTFDRARQLRRAMTPPEVLLWQQLRGGALGRRFRRQHAVGPYILDFYCADGKLAIEVDGFAHDAAEQMRHDAVRTAWLNERGIRVLRVPAADVLHPERRVRVLEGILAALDSAER